MQTTALIIPYTSAGIRWHLTNNVFGLTDYTIDNIVLMCEKVNRGEVDIHSDHLNIGCTPAEMLADLQIEYNED